jgi:hypothetical protein
MIRPTNVYILRQSDPTGVKLSDHPQAAQFDHLEVGLNVGCDNLTHEQSDPFSAPPGLGEQLGRRHTDGTVKKKVLRHPRELHPRMGQPGTSLT